MKQFLSGCLNVLLPMAVCMLLDYFFKLSYPVWMGIYILLFAVFSGIIAFKTGRKKLCFGKEKRKQVLELGAVGLVFYLLITFDIIPIKEQEERLVFQVVMLGVAVLAVLEFLFCIGIERYRDRRNME